MFLCVNSRNGTDQSPGILMLRIVEDILCSTVFHDPAGIHNCDPLAHAGNHAKVMGDHDDRHAKLVLQFHHQLQDLCLYGHIKCCCRLICDQELWFAGKCHSDHDSLSHTTGQLMRILL